MGCITEGANDEGNINSFDTSNTVDLFCNGVADMNTFTITLTPFRALQTKRGYERDGYQVSMVELYKTSHIDDTFKYQFALTSNDLVVKAVCNV